LQRTTPLSRFWKPNRSKHTFLETNQGLGGRVARITQLVSTNAGNRAFGFHKRKWGGISLARTREYQAQTGEY
jgi:hypothetical protein